MLSRMARAKWACGVGPGDSRPRRRAFPGWPGRCDRPDAARRAGHPLPAAMPAAISIICSYSSASTGIVLPRVGIKELIPEPAQGDPAAARYRPGDSTVPGITDRMVSSARFSVSATKPSVQPARTAAVPATSNSIPARTTPAPRAFAAVSPAPAAISVPGASPKSAAGPGCTSPISVAGIHDAGQLVHVQAEALAKLLGPRATLVRQRTRRSECRCDR